MINFKNMNKYIKIVALLITCGLVSCEDFLSEKPKEQVIPTVTKDYEMLLNSYTVLETVGTNNCYLTDDVFLPDTDPVHDLSIQTVYPTRLRFYKLAEELYTTGEKDWDWGCYNAIYTFNVVINEVLNSKNGTESEKKKIYAEALLARAFQYHQLITLYAKAYDKATADKTAGVPLILVPDINQTNISRATIQEVYDRMEADLKEAIPLLPNRPTLNAFRGSKPAAEALLARFYLYQGRYNEALELVESVIRVKPDILDLNNYAVVDSGAGNGRTNVPIYDKNPEALYIKTTSSLGMNSRAYVDLDLLNTFDKNNDRRFKLFITKHYRNKNLIYDLWAPAMDPNAGITIPEVYLVAAECHARLGDLTAAMNRLEDLRKKRYENYSAIPTGSLTKNDVIKLILAERRRELMMIPCIRLADIKRLGLEPEFSQSVKRTINGVTTTIPPTSNRFVLQIPHIVMKFNPDMEQNSRKD